jgi:hypothetical protein
METTIRALQDQVNAALLGSDWQALDRLIAPNARSAAASKQRGRRDPYWPPCRYPTQLPRPVTRS